MRWNKFEKQYWKNNIVQKSGVDLCICEVVKNWNDALRLNKGLKNHLAFVFNRLEHLPRFIDQSKN